MTDNDHIKITLPTDGGAPTVEGTKAIAAEVKYGLDDGVLVVKYEFTAAGDDAISAGSMTAEFRMTPPALAANVGSLSEQAKIAADYAEGFIDVVTGEFLPDTLRGAFQAAADAAVPDIAKSILGDTPDDAVETVMKIVQALASVLLIKAQYDKDKAHAEVDPFLDAGSAAEFGFTPEQVDEMRGWLHIAIDGMTTA